MTAQAGQPRPMAEWMRMLDQIEEALGRSLARVEEPAAAAPPVGGGAADAAFARLEERLSRVADRLDDATRQVQEADADVAAGADGVRRWLDALAASRRRLADAAA